MNGRSNGRRATWGAVLVCFGVLSSGCGSVALESRWRPEPAGPASESDFWQGVAREEESGVKIATMNDGEDLYVLLEPGDERGGMQLLRGFTLWFGSSPEQKEFGIRSAGNAGRSDGPPPPRGAGPDPEAVEKRVRESWSSVHVLSGEGHAVREAELAEAGVHLDLAAGPAPRWVFRVPLESAQADFVSIGSGPGEQIGFGLETAAFSRPSAPPGGRGSGGGPPGGGRGGRGGGGGRSGGGSGGEFRGPPKPIDFWTGLKLASSVDESPAGDG